MIFNKSGWLVIAVLFVFSAAGRAQMEGNPENFCRNGAFPYDAKDFKLAKVIAQKSEKVHFYKDERNCPNDSACQDKTYLIANDTAIVSRTFGDYACVWFEPKKGFETVGWIKTNKLEIYQPNQNPRLTDWLGEWTDDGNSLRIKRDSADKNALSVSGVAFWGSGNNIHDGAVDASAAPANNVLNVKEEYGCAVTLRLVGQLLVVTDNLQCGGANVSFGGVYRKTAKK